MSMRIQMTFKLPVKIFKEKEWFVGWCPALDVASQGETPEKAKAHLGEALLLFLETCLDHGTLDEVLRECGFVPVISDEPYVAKPEETEMAGDTIDVPLYFLAKSAGSS